LYLEGNAFMNIYRGVSLAVITASLLFCRLASADPSASTSDQASTGQAANNAAHPSASDWQTDGTLYLWLPGVHGNLSAFGYNVGFKASPADIISHADLGILGVLGVKYHRLVLIADFIYGPLKASRTSTVVLLPNQPVVTSDVKYSAFILDPEVGYRVLNHENLKIDGLFGYRYFHQGITLNVATPQHNASSYSGTNYTDPVVGARILYPITSKLLATIWGDVGGWGAGSQLDYNMVGALSYKIARRWALGAAWRYLYVDYKSANLTTVTAQSGIVFGVTYHISGAEQVN
jgi:hypothetical protein